MLINGTELSSVLQEFVKLYLIKQSPPAMNNSIEATVRDEREGIYYILLVLGLLGLVMFFLLVSNFNGQKHINEPHYKYFDENPKKKPNFLKFVKEAPSLVLENRCVVAMPDKRGNVGGKGETSETIVEKA